MRRVFLIINLCILVFAVGCSNDIEPNAVQIRIMNSSSFQFLDIIVNTGGGENNYGNILSNQSSDYKSFNSAYRYAYVELKIEGEPFILQPIDYVGETLLASGKYTYDITASETGSKYDRLSLTLIED